MTDAPLTAQSNVVFELTGPAGTILVPARVLRTDLVEGSAPYRIACAFNRSISSDMLAAARRADLRQPLRAYRGTCGRAIP